MIKIIKATLNDADLISELGKNTFIESHSDSAAKEDVDYYVSQKFTPETLTLELENKDNIFHLIYVGEKLAGYSKIILNQTNEKISHNKVTKLERLYILKSFYDLKLGLKLFEFNVEYSKSHHQKGMWLNVWTENHRAVAFYEKAGFKNIGNTSFFISPKHANPNYWLYLEY